MRGWVAPDPVQLSSRMMWVMTHWPCRFFLATCAFAQDSLMRNVSLKYLDTTKTEDLSIKHSKAKISVGFIYTIGEMRTVGKVLLDARFRVRYVPGAHRCIASVVSFSGRISSSIACIHCKSGRRPKHQQASDSGQEDNNKEANSALPPCPVW